jgi:hypothetical protein
LLAILLAVGMAQSVASSALGLFDRNQGIEKVTQNEFSMADPIAPFLSKKVRFLLSGAKIERSPRRAVLEMLEGS